MPWQSSARYHYLSAPLALLILIGLCLSCQNAVAQAQNFSAQHPFDNFKGWWSGEGRIGFKDGISETLICRATYFLANGGQNLTQNLRCSTQSLKVEIKSELSHQGGKVSGHWKESIYNVGGEVTGQVKASGMTLFIKGEDLGATMHVIARKNRQIVEIHFNGVEDVIGVSILFEKG